MLVGGAPPHLHLPFYTIVRYVVYCVCLAMNRQFHEAVRRLTNIPLQFPSDIFVLFMQPFSSSLSFLFPFVSFEKFVSNYEISIFPFFSYVMKIVRFLSMNFPNNFLFGCTTIMMLLLMIMMFTVFYWIFSLFHFLSPVIFRYVFISFVFFMHVLYEFSVLLWISLRFVCSLFFLYFFVSFSFIICVFSSHFVLGFSFWFLVFLYKLFSLIMYIL